MSLVEYSESEDEDPVPVSPKKRRLNPDPKGSSQPDDLPPLPPAFRDLYSSTVRLSNNDDPNLHGGRTRITPHVEGNWSAHVYLEWNPSPTDTQLLIHLLTQIPQSATQYPLQSLLVSSLSVPLPLHVSLSVPLVLRTETKDAFLSSMLQALKSALSKSSVTVSPIELAWHANEEGTRSFLVLRVGRAEEDSMALKKLLDAANAVAARFGCGVLYAGGRKGGEAVKFNGDAGGEMDASGCFHISLAWSLDAAAKLEDDLAQSASELVGTMEKVKALNISFSEVKVRLGKDVFTVPLGRTRGQQKGILG